MLLQRLKEYAEQRMALPPPLYSETPVRYVIDLDADGGLLNPQPMDTADPSSPATRRGQRRAMPQVQRSSGVKPLLLADNSEYTLGLGRAQSRPDRVTECHRAYVAQVEQCAEETGNPGVQAVVHFLHAEPTAALHLPDDFDLGATVTFRVGGLFPTESSEVQGFWARLNDPAAAERPTVMQCLICGRDGPVLRLIQGKVKPVPNGQTAGVAIISANAAAFESYGLEQSLTAPVCATCGDHFTKAANHLLTSSTERITLGGAAFLFWTREEVGFDFRSWFDQPDPAQVRQLLETVRSGRALPEIDDTAFYATSLSGSGGRAVVRDWLDSTVGEARRHLALWFQRQAIVGTYGEPATPLRLFTLASATVRDASKDLAPPTPRALLRSALTGGPLPLDLLALAVRRNHAEQGVTRPRAALIKLVLVSQPGLLPAGLPAAQLEFTMVQLDPQHPRPAYHCGRLLAVLEQAQRAAIPGINATIVDRFFGTASTAPGSVFPRLIRGAQPHLAKLERDRPGMGRALQRRLEDVLAPIATFPTVLTLMDQGLFALGYYHQRAHDRAAAREAAERRRAAGEPPPDDLSPEDL